LTEGVIAGGILGAEIGEVGEIAVRVEISAGGETVARPSAVAEVETSPAPAVGPCQECLEGAQCLAGLRVWVQGLLPWVDLCLEDPAWPGGHLPTCLQLGARWVVEWGRLEWEV
jgi:hypothetical protein